MHKMDWLQLALFVVALAVITKPMGLYLVRVLDANGRTWLDMAANFVDENEHVVERFTLIDADTILYEAAITDPTVFVKPVQMRFTLKRVPAEQQILEYSCLEGERSLQHYTEEDGGRKRREK